MASRKASRVEKQAGPCRQAMALNRTSASTFFSCGAKRVGEFAGVQFDQLVELLGALGPPRIPETRIGQGSSGSNSRRVLKGIQDPLAGRLPGVRVGNAGGGRDGEDIGRLGQGDVALALGARSWSGVHLSSL